MELPDDIEQQILEYLHLEYGESPEDEDALKLSELRYEGIHEMEGVPTHCWSFPSTSDEMWATVEPHEDTYCIGMSRKPKALREKPYSSLLLNISGKTSQKFRIPYIKNEEYRVSSFENHFDITLADGRKLSVYSEIYFMPNPAQAMLSISMGDQELTMKFGVGVELTLALDSDTEVYAKVGDLSWG